MKLKYVGSNSNSFLSSADFVFKINFSKKSFSGKQSIQIRNDDLSVLTWIQTVCKRYKTVADSKNRH